MHTETTPVFFAKQNSISTRGGESSEKTPLFIKPIYKQKKAYLK
jgi:hypothetical protein